MAGQDSEKFQEIFDRLRETEAQTRAQNERMSALCDRIDNFSTVTDKFFAIVEQRHKDEALKFDAICEHEKHMLDAAAKREDKMWKVIVYLIGAVLATVIGPKAIKEVTGKVSEMPFASVYRQEILPMNDHYLDGFRAKSEGCFV